MRGGARSGTGPKPILEDPSKRTFLLEASHIKIIQRWMKDHDLNASASIRAILEKADAN